MGLAPDVGADEVNAANTPPVIEVVNPVNGQIVRTFSSIQIQAQAHVPGGTASVEFYVNSTLVGSDTTEPYELTWTPTRRGTYSIVAVAIDSAGNRASSPPVTITANRKGR